MGVWPQKTLILLFGFGISLVLWGSGADLAIQLWLADHYNQGFNNVFRWLGWLGLGRTQIIFTLSVWIILVLKRCASDARLSQLCRKQGIIVAVKSLDRRINVWLWTLPVFLITGVLAIAFKLLVGRPRPKEILFNHMPYGETFPILMGGHHFKASLMSWPSGHSASTFAIGTLLLLAYPERKILITIVMVALAASRFLALTPHYLGDVVAGATLGSVVALAMAPWLGLAPKK